MNQILDGAAKLTAMVIRLESERDAAIARAELAENELAAQRAMYDSLKPDWSRAPDDNPPPTHYVIDATGTAQWLWAMRGEIDALIEPIRNSGAWLLRYVYRTEVATLLDLPLGVDWRLCKWVRPSDNDLLSPDQEDRDARGS